jgi:hypothetical protein
LKEAIKAGNGGAACRMREGEIVAKLELWGDGGVAGEGQNAQKISALTCLIMTHMMERFARIGLSCSV